MCLDWWFYFQCVPTILVLISMCTCNGGIWVLFCSRFGTQVSTREETSLEELGVSMHDSTWSHLNSTVVREGVHGLVTGGVTPCEFPSSFYSLTLHRYYTLFLQLQVGLFYLFIVVSAQLAKIIFSKHFPQCSIKTDVYMIILF